MKLVFFVSVVFLNTNSVFKRCHFFPFLKNCFGVPVLLSSRNENSANAGFPQSGLPHPASSPGLYLSPGGGGGVDVASLQWRVEKDGP